MALRFVPLNWLGYWNFIPLTILAAVATFSRPSNNLGRNQRCVGCNTASTLAG